LEDDFRIGAENWSWISKCAISQNMKSQGRSVLQYNDKQDLISISKKNFFDMLVIQILFSDKRMAIP